MTRHPLVVVAPTPRAAFGSCLAVVALLAVVATEAAAQTTAVLRGVVLDTQGGVLPGAVVRLSQGVTGLERETTTDASGSFQLTNVPLDAYRVRVDVPGFTPHLQTVELRSSVPVHLEIVLELSPQADTITVTPPPMLVDASSAGTRTQVSMATIEQLPAAVGSRGLESVLVSFPGFAQNANGAIHPRGAHNQMTFVIDGLTITDQLTGAFANALDAGIVQSVELITGNVPAEFGSKVSGVAVITSRSGMGSGRRLAGDVSIARAGFDTWHAAAQGGGGGARLGYFGSMTAMRTGRFLDQVSLDNLHNDGAFGRAFARVDFLASPRDMVKAQLMGGRSAFELANLRSQEAAGQDQVQRLGDAAVWVSFLRTVDERSTAEATVGYRATSARLAPSLGDTPVTASQRRHLSTLSTALRYSRASGARMWRAGVDLQHFPVREHFTMALTASRFNVPGSPTFNRALLDHDLTRGGEPFAFNAEGAGQQYSAFVQVTAPWRRATLVLGGRQDVYTFLVRAAQFQPRVGVTYELPGTLGVVRASYNRNLQTPPNENLLLSSSAAAAALAPDSVTAALGGAHRPIRPERQRVYEVGFQRGLGESASLDLSLYRKHSKDQQDNNNFFDTGIIFPTTLAEIRVTGAEGRLSWRHGHDLSGTVSATTGRAVSTPPFTGGLFLGQDAVDLLSAGPFLIDHDQRFSLHATAQYDAPGPWWAGASVRHDSGLVANPSNPAVVAADPDFSDLLPLVDLDSSVPRVRPRTIVDLAAGFDYRPAGQRRWSVQVQVTNVGDRRALYNFQSVFVGTRLVQPRTASIRFRTHF